jgi:hypothetical protein
MLTSAAVAGAQVTGKAKSSSASQVMAELAEGKLSPAVSKAGDTIVVRLKQDVKSNGQVVLKKGTAISGIVRNIERAEEASVKAERRTTPGSMMEIEWLTPVVEGKRAVTVSIALQSVGGIAHYAKASAAVGSGASSGLLPGATPVISNPAMLSMPTVVAADPETSFAIKSGLGAPSAQLFRVGRGRLTGSGGPQQTVDLYSHLNNDTVITSANRDFEISVGAEMQLLIGVNKN